MGPQSERAARVLKSGEGTFSLGLASGQAQNRQETQIAAGDRDSRSDVVDR